MSRVLTTLTLRRHGGAARTALVAALFVAGCSSGTSESSAPSDSLGTVEGSVSAGEPIESATNSQPEESTSTGSPSTDSTPTDSASADSTSAAGDPTSEAASGGADGFEFLPLNQAVGYGLLRVMGLDERPNPRDVVIYEAIPNELPRVAGVITTVPQTPLAHVNLRAVQDGVPNAAVANVLDDSTITALVGRYVKYTVTATDFTVEAATQDEVEAHHAAARPAQQQTPERDLTVKEIAPLSEIGFEEWTSYGVKAANLATLASFDLPEADVPDGYAVPFFYYDEFMSANGLYDRVKDLLDDPEFRSDPEVQAAKLTELRDLIKDASLPGWMEADLERVQNSLPAGAPIRCRSSTNNEDLPNFSGAGLYDSRTQHPDEGPLSKCIKQVYASVWNLRAFLERDFYRIDHLTTAMGVVLHPNFEGELANGVAVTTDPVYGSEDSYYVNTQVGEDLVTNPDSLSIPEELLLYGDGTSYVVAYSNLVEPGTTVMTTAQTSALHASLATIHSRFAELYEVAAGEPFAIDVEFKIDADGSLSIKQARTWVFN